MNTSLLYHILDVVFLRSYKKMAGVAAFSIVAFMTYIHSFGYFSKFKFPCCPMGWNGFFIKFEFPISVFANSARPFPASAFNRNDFVPKSYNIWKVRFRHMITNKPPSPESAKTEMASRSIPVAMVG